MPEGTTSDTGTDLELTHEPVSLRTWSDVERISTKDFAALSAEELQLVRAALGRLAWDIEDRRTRRWIAGRGSRIDLRRAMARSLRTGGEITVLPTRRRRIRPRPIVLLCDVSGSMEQYTRTLLLFAHKLTRSKRDVEAFLFATRLTRITSELRSARPDAAMAAVSRAVRDWSGGTRIGDALAALNREHGGRVGRGAVVVVLSDGWDRGEPAQLAGEMARLSRTAHRLVWLNPLKADPRYEPLARGMAAALPHVDHFLSGHSVASLEELAELLEEGMG